MGLRQDNRSVVAEPFLVHGFWVGQSTARKCGIQDGPTWVANANTVDAGGGLLSSGIVRVETTRELKYFVEEDVQFVEKGARRRSS